MALLGPWPTQDAAGVSVAATRRLIAGEFRRPGILGAAPTVTGRADGAYDVGAFQAVTQRTAAGMERVANDGTIVAGDPLTTAPASNSRIEVIWVRSRFVLAGDAVNTPEIGVTLGATAASPAKPAIPPGALELATARRYSTDTTTQTVTITVAPQFTAVVGAAPAGTIEAFAGAAVAGGWLLCDGAAVSRSVYADLFAAIGTAYGAGDGSTTFNVPNLKGRIPVGRDSAQSEFDVLGESGGEKAHTLTVAEMPSHQHTQALGGSLSTVANSSGSFVVGNANTALTTPTGGDGAHNNLQPYVVVNYIIKT